MRRPVADPPGAWERLLRRALRDPATAAGILGDLREEFHSLRRSQGVSAARAWYRLQALRLAVRYCVPDRRPRGPAPASVGAAVWREMRTLLRKPGQPLVSAVVLGLGVAMATFTFSVHHGALGQGLGFVEEERVVAVERTRPSEGIRNIWLSPHELLDFRGAQSTLSTLSAYRSGTADVLRGGVPHQYVVAWLTVDALETMGIAPVLGRGFNADDARPGAPSVALISFRLWREEFASGEGVLGGSLRIDGAPVTVVGVMPDGFRFPASTDLWMPLPLDRARVVRGDGAPVLAFGRLTEEETVETASDDFLRIANELAALYPDTDQGLSVEVRPISDVLLPGRLAPVLRALLGAGCFLLVLAGANLATVLTARASNRARETAIRAALGGTRFQVALPFLVEASVVATLGCAVGVALTGMALGRFDAALGPSRPYFIRFDMDGSVVAWAVGVAIASVLCAVWLAVRRTGTADLSRAIGSDRSGAANRARSRFDSGLLVLQAALSCMLLVAAALASRSMRSLSTFDFGFRDSGVLVAEIELSSDRYEEEEARRLFFRDALAGLRRIPGVDESALATRLPGMATRRVRVEIEGEPPPEGQQQVARSASVSPGYWSAFDIPFQAGHMPAPASTETDVAVVNESFVRRYFRNADRVGRRIRWSIGRDDPGPWHTVVGVVPDLVMEGFPTYGRAESAGFYTPLDADAPASLWLAVRPTSDGAVDASDVRQAIVGVDPALPVLALRDIESLLADETGFFRVFGSVFVALGVAASVLGAFGLYGVLALAVAGRGREVGIRVALGADRASVIRRVGWGTTRVVLAGLLVGLAASWLGAGLLSFALFEVDSHDPVAFALAPLILLAASTIAAAGPLARALGADPVEVLRGEQ